MILINKTQSMEYTIIKILNKIRKNIILTRQNSFFLIPGILRKLESKANKNY